MTRAFHGARQGTTSATAGQQPGLVDPANPAQRAKTPANTGGPVFAAASMHDDLGREASLLANGSENVPIHPQQVATEGSDKQGWGGDAALHDPTGIGRGT